MWRLTRPGEFLLTSCTLFSSKTWGVPPSQNLVVPKWEVFLSLLLDLRPHLWALCIVSFPLISTSLVLCGFEFQRILNIYSPNLFFFFFYINFFMWFSVGVNYRDPKALVLNGQVCLVAWNKLVECFGLGIKSISSYLRGINVSYSLFWIIFWFWFDYGMLENDVGQTKTLQ